MPEAIDQMRIRAAVREILLAVGEDPDREGLRETPDRIARMYTEIFAGLRKDAGEQLRKTFTEKYDEMVLVRDIGFEGHGCAISQAAASIASEEYVGMPVDEVAGLNGDWLIELLGIPISATRRRCALLNLKVMRGAITGDASWPNGSD